MRPVRNGRLPGAPSTACWRRLDPIAISRPTAIWRSAATSCVSSNGEAALRPTTTPTRPSIGARKRLAMERKSATLPPIALASRECSCARCAVIAPGRRGLWTKRRSSQRRVRTRRRSGTPRGMSPTMPGPALARKSRSHIALLPGRQGRKNQEPQGARAEYSGSRQALCGCGRYGFADRLQLCAENCLQRQGANPL